MADVQKALILEADALNRQCIQIIRDIRKIRLDQGILMPLMNKQKRPAIVDTVLRPTPVTPPEDFRKTLDAVYSDKMYLERLFMAEAQLERLQTYYLQATEYEFWEHVQNRVGKPAKARRRIVSNVEQEELTGSIVKLWKYFDEHRFRKVVRIGKRLMSKALAWKKHKELGKVWFILGDLIHLVGNAFVELNLYSQAHDLFIMEGELSDECKSVLFEKRHLDNMARLYCIVGLYDSAIEWFNTRSNYGAEGLEKVWIDYQMSLCYFCDEQYEEAQEKITSVLKCAREQNLTEWEFNGELLLAAIFSCSSLAPNECLKGCCSAVERALLCALKLDDTMRINVAFKFLQVCHNAVHDKGLPTTEYFSRPMDRMCSKETGSNHGYTSRWLRETLLQVERNNETI